jgi:hypothetical protein
MFVDIGKVARIAADQRVLSPRLMRDGTVGTSRGEMRPRGVVESDRSRKVEALLIAALTALVAVALIAVEITPYGFDRFVWVGGAVLLATLLALWRRQRSSARPWVVLVASLAFVVVGYALWLWWYLAVHQPQLV